MALSRRVCQLAREAPAGVIPVHEHRHRDTSALSLQHDVQPPEEPGPQAPECRDHGPWGSPRPPATMTVWQPDREGSWPGWYYVDPDGNTFGIHQPDPAAA